MQHVKLIPHAVEPMATVASQCLAHHAAKFDCLSRGHARVTYTARHSTTAHSNEVLTRPIYDIVCADGREPVRASPVSKLCSMRSHCTKCQSYRFRSELSLCFQVNAVLSNMTQPEGDAVRAGAQGAERMTARNSD